MLNPSINDLMSKVDSRYTLVVAASKRAREIIEGEESLIRVDSNKPVTIATHEIAQDKVHYERDESDL
ncbi:MAG: DNA-directed RNA polymerase subunit omega [Anaeromicrobium sp.]|jgi:DNA-directed RNA polymerase subunit omega|uniref:DNA-directed RNA polymerase subunit omega n=1 Tax=Anaeromicrobium sp. TaxID=1929132 RepID=UPI0025D03C45|nr:DNA-directed RNA polymerase subunit omega [Anaeromicrobium sp.]MCT4594905.1 DNA-directed RNA polymerase subunit omega [Anaeromicrobium sp.]